MTPTSSAPTQRPRARRGDGDRLRDEILDAAEALLVEAGSIDAVSIRGIARSVGCTPPALYLHFEDKDELFFHVCSRRFDEFNSQIRAAVEGIDDVVEAMLAMGRAYVDYGTQHPEAYRVLFNVRGAESIIPDDVDPAELPGMQAFGLLVDTIEWGVRDGVFEASEPVAAAIGIWATMHGLVMILDGHDAKDGMIDIPDDVVDRVCRQAMDGLRVRP